MPDNSPSGRRDYSGGAGAAVASVGPPQPAPGGLERAAYFSLLAFAASLQISIAAAGILLGLTAILWLALVATRRERIEVPSMFWPLAAYAGMSLVAAFFSIDPHK